MTKIFPTDRQLLALTGEDAPKFLQGLVSADIATLAEGKAAWAALLTPQGKWLADFFVVRDGDRLLLDVEAGQAEMITARLMRFRLRSRVALAPAGLGVTLVWDGPPPAIGLAVADPRLAEAGFRLLHRPEEAPAATADREAWDRHRIALGLPDGSRDLEPEKTVLLEAGFDELAGVSWTKGCWMGQELTARTKYRGLLKRRLCPVAIEGPLPPPGTRILDASGAEVGELRSGVAGLGLALLRLGAIAGGQELHTAEATIRPQPPAWLRLPGAIGGAAPA